MYLHQQPAKHCRQCLSRSALSDASKSIFVVPKTRLNLGEREFSVAAPQAWNRPPAELITFQACAENFYLPDCLQQLTFLIFFYNSYISYIFIHVII